METPQLARVFPEKCLKLLLRLYLTEGVPQLAGVNGCLLYTSKGLSVPVLRRFFVCIKTFFSIYAIVS